MTKKPLALLGVSLLLLAACTPVEQQAINDVLDQEQPEQISSEEGEVESEMDAWAGQDQATAPDESITEEGVDPRTPPSQSEEQALQQGSYRDYNASVLADGQVKVLFFHASWCPICKSADGKLKAWYASQTVPTTVYKVDYDSETELKNQYGVTYQHTFVKVDGQGNLIEKIQTPTDEQLQTLLGA